MVTYGLFLAQFSAIILKNSELPKEKSKLSDSTCIGILASKNTTLMLSPFTNYAIFEAFGKYQNDRRFNFDTRE